MIRRPILPFTALLLIAGVGACAGPKAATPSSAAATAKGPTLTPQEREAAVKDLEATRQAFLASIKGLSDAQFHFKPAPDRWSVAEVSEHIVVTEERLYGMLTQKLVHNTTPPELLAQVQHDDQRLTQMVTDRSHKIQAPEMLRPTGRFPTLEAVTAAFVLDRDKALTYVQSTQDDLRSHAEPHPVLKALDGYQWLLLLSAHSARHTAQIEEVKADPNFPKS